MYEDVLRGMIESGEVEIGIRVFRNKGGEPLWFVWDGGLTIHVYAQRFPDMKTSVVDNDIDRFAREFTVITLGEPIDHLRYDEAAAEVRASVNQWIDDNSVRDIALQLESAGIRRR